MMLLAFGYCTVALSPYAGMNCYHKNCFYVRLLLSDTLQRGFSPRNNLFPLRTVLLQIGERSPYNRPRMPRREVEIQFYSFFNLGARWWLVVNAALRPLYPRKRPGTHCIGGWVSLRYFLDRCGKSRPHWDTIPGPSSLQRVAVPTQLTWLRFS